MRVRIGVRSPATGSAQYRIATRSGALPEDTQRRVVVPVCVPAGSFADVSVAGSSSARVDEVPLSPDVEGTRAVGVLLGPIAVRRSGQGC